MCTFTKRDDFHLICLKLKYRDPVCNVVQLYYIMWLFWTHFLLSVSESKLDNWLLLEHLHGSDVYNSLMNDLGLDTCR